MPSDLKLNVQSVTPDVTLTLDDTYIGSAYSPTVTVDEIEGGHEVTITHKAPSGIVTDTFGVLDGEDGTDGADGYSPTVEIESTTDAHTITITDADGAHSYTVDTYADEEAARATAESSRVAAEQSRVTAESARAAAESSRTAAETARASAETARTTAEQSRASAESARATAESSRASAEATRASAETARVSAESTRATAEQARATVEMARATAESNRATAEQGRVTAETARDTAESARATAESGRASAETARVAAESARASAESTRASEWATIKAEAEDATSAAESATQDATAAAAEARAASAATWLSGNVLFGELEEAYVLTADDAYAAPPKGVEVFGKSTQDGTPTPDAPVPIKSVDALTLQLRRKNLLNIVNTDGVTVNGNVITTSGSWRDLFTGTTGQSAKVTDLTKLPVLPAGTYAVSGTRNGSGTVCIFAVDDAGNISGIKTYSASATSLSYVMVLETATRITIRDSAADMLTNVQIEYGTTATAYAPYVGQSVQIPLSDHIARSLPDGTRDELTLTYQGPSTRDGWGVFGASLVQRISEIADLSKLEWSTDTSRTYQVFVATKPSDATDGWASNGLCEAYQVTGNSSYAGFGNNDYDGQIKALQNRSYNIGLQNHAVTTAADLVTSLEGIGLVYALAEPITHDLGTVELPVNPASDLTAWADGGSAQPTMAMEYERALSIVIPRIEAAISDLATS